jgi:hypothetical protein
MNTAVVEIDKVVKDIKSIKDDAQTRMRKKFHTLLKPYLQASGPISFRAYTAYFNDGDECHYNVYNDLESLFVDGTRLDELSCDYTETIKLKTQEDVNQHKEICDIFDNYFCETRDYIGLDGDKWKKGVNKDKIKKRLDAIKKVQSILQEFGDDFYRDMFGDHVEVTLDIKEITTESYRDHE